ncbi:MAG: enoyl-CoA hydratase/isomerase family protein, partial [OCS116 cluster bacterium]|nr:enoyl-CoA hydratase/isomerase family protein [OCS116 cluster bacterium]
MQTVTYELNEDIGVIRINNPPVNALSQNVRSGLLQCLEIAQNDASKAIIVYCEGRTFIAGAEISEFDKPPLLPTLPEVLAMFEKSNKLVIAAIHGSALGGGFETALACHYRCAVKTAKVGFPEVKLGLIPGAGGTQRTPRLCGVEAALNLMTNGAPISALKAFDLGLIDKIIENENLL